MKELSDWRKIVLLPVVLDNYIGWNASILSFQFSHYIKLCAKKNIGENDERICTTLSGGVDSSLCLAIIRRELGPEQEIHTFTTAIHKKHPDIVCARQVAKLFNTIHHEFIPQEGDILEAQKLFENLWPKEAERMGAIGVYLTYKNISESGFKSVIAHDGIDELMGGYWEHREENNAVFKEKIFADLWGQLSSTHLKPLENKASYFGINVLFPYLQKGIVEYVSQIPVWQRVSQGIGKVPLKKVAEDFLPNAIVYRDKIGFCDSLTRI